jgi:carboxyl-terminal processing protease
VAKYYIPSGRCIQAIDYSHKDEDGYAHKVPDSLLAEFQTKNGRKVFDGAGIEPDIYFEPEQMSPITMSLFTKYVLFDYANEFYLGHDSIPSAEEFVFTDEMYDDFVEYVNNREDFEYTTATEKTLQKLIEVSEKEAYYASISAEIEALQEILNHNKDEDLLTHKDIISEILAIEIVSRYYYQKGKVITSLKSDPEVKKAIELIEETTNYGSILSGKSAGMN